MCRSVILCTNLKEWTNDGWISCRDGWCIGIIIITTTAVVGGTCACIGRVLMTWSFFRFDASNTASTATTNTSMSWTLFSSIERRFIIAFLFFIRSLAFWIFPFHRLCYLSFFLGSTFKSTSTSFFDSKLVVSMAGCFRIFFLVGFLWRFCLHLDSEWLLFLLLSPLLSSSFGVVEGVDPFSSSFSGVDSWLFVFPTAPTSASFVKIPWVGELKFFQDTQ